MNDDKVKSDELTVSELSEVKGGLPYEKPLLISFEDAKHTCNEGLVCSTGDGINACTVGSKCRSGTYEDPEI